MDIIDMLEELPGLVQIETLNCYKNVVGPPAFKKILLGALK